MSQDGEIVEVDCYRCGRKTCLPDPEWEDWSGMCPACVIRQEVMPLIEDERIRRLLEFMMAVPDQVADMLQERIDSVDVAVIAPGAPEGVSNIISTFMKAILNDQTSRDKLKEVIGVVEGLNEQQVRSRPEGMDQVARARVRNNPRWG